MIPARCLFVSSAVLLLSCCWIPSNEGIQCFKCNSDTDASCTDVASSGDAIPAENCENPDTLVQNWIASHGLEKYGVGKVNLAEGLHMANDAANDQGNLKNVTACAFFFASSENDLTSAVDSAVAKTRDAVGDKNANDGVTIHKWTMRDCVTMRFNQDVAESQANRCVPVRETKSFAKLHFCTCTTDKCNEGTGSLKELIGEAEGSGCTKSGMLLSNVVILLFASFWSQSITL